MKSRPLSAMLVFLFLSFSPALAQEDTEGCRDSSVLTRMPGCSIGQCEVKEFDAAELQIGTTAQGMERNRLEGQKEALFYQCPETLSSLQIARNAENALKKSGFTVVYSGLSEFNNPVVTARKGAQWVEVEASTSNGGYYLTTLRVKEMEQRMEATAEAMEAEINQSGRVSVYGINFDTGKATLKPDSEKVLSEILSLVKKNPAWKLRVEGHTDNAGAKVMNQKLSEQRAAAVASWLVSHGIEASRLASQGFGDSRPAADNTTEEGRARNRRVELVKM